MTEEQCQEIVKAILRLDPKRERIFLDENWVVYLVNNGKTIGTMHPLTFLDITREMVVAESGP